jgi:hypothetical protein
MKLKWLATTAILAKTFAIWEQIHLQIRADADNAFNHASFGLPSGSLRLTVQEE